jgi:hypothetical protein
MTFDAKPIPLDVEWAKQLMLKSQAKQRRQGHDVRYTEDFPAAYPMASQLLVDERGRLIVGRQVKGKNFLRYTAFDGDGNQIEIDYAPVLTNWLLAAHGDRVWLSALVDDKAVVYGVSKGKLKDLFLELAPEAMRDDL